VSEENIKRIAVISLSNLSRDPRVWRQIRCLAECGYEVTAAGFDDPQIEGVEFVQMQSVALASAKTEQGKALSAIKNRHERLRNILRALVPSRKVRDLLRSLYKALIHSKRLLRKIFLQIKKFFIKILKTIAKSSKPIASKTKAAFSMDRYYRDNYENNDCEKASARHRSFREMLKEIDFEIKEMDALTTKKVSHGVAALKARQFDLVVANDFSALPIAFAVKGKAKIVYDAHEYTLDQYNSVEWREKRLPYIKYILTKYIRHLDGMMTVCEGIAAQYKKDFGVQPVVVTNAPDYHADLAPSPVRKDRIRLVHHGVAHPARSIEEMIDTVALLDERFTLDFYLVGNNEAYKNELMARAAKIGRISFNEPVPMDSLSRVLNRYDIGFYILMPISFNTLHALPNKLFEFVQARLMIAIGPSPEMASYVQKYSLGVVAKDFTPESMAESLNRLTADDVAEFKRNSHKCARQLSSEAQFTIMSAFFDSLV